MGIYEQWMSSAYTRNGQWEKKVWDSYLPLEQKIYEYFLTEKVNTLSGTVKELAERFNMSPMYFIGFLDGISGALSDAPNLEEFDEDSAVNISFEWEALYKKMVEYKAEHLYTLPEWTNIFSEEEQQRLYKEQKTSRTVVNEGPKVGRNDPCPCGSGKKYKKCCGA